MPKFCFQLPDDAMATRPLGVNQLKGMKKSRTGQRGFEVSLGTKMASSIPKARGFIANGKNLGIEKTNRPLAEANLTKASRRIRRWVRLRCGSSSRK